MMRLTQLALIMTAVFALATASTFAQSPLKFGFKGGVNMASFTGDDADGFDGRSGIIGGVFASLSLRGGFSIQPELLYSQKGAEGPTEYAGHPVDAKIKTDYIEIPVLVKYRLGSKGPISPCVFGGPAFSFVRSSKTDGAITGLPLLGGEHDNYNETSSDLGLVLGVGLDLSLGKSLLTVEARYTAGTKTVWEDVNLGEVPDDEWYWADETTGAAYDQKNSAIALMVGFRL